jgi:small subunit ribosomal protein S1
MFVAEHPKGSLVQGKVKEVDAKGAIIQLEEGVEGYLRASELMRDRVEDARMVLKEGKEVEAKFIGVDRKKRTISLSIKAKILEEEENALQDYGSTDVSSGSATFGDLLKEQMDNVEDENTTGDQPALEMPITEVMPEQEEQSVDNTEEETDKPSEY